MDATMEATLCIANTLVHSDQLQILTVWDSSPPVLHQNEVSTYYDPVNRHVFKQTLYCGQRNERFLLRRRHDIQTLRDDTAYQSVA